MLVADRLFAASKEIKETLAVNLVWGTEFSLEAHWDQVKALRVALCKDWTTEETAFLERLSGSNKVMGNQVEMAYNLGAWLTALPPRLNGTEMCPLDIWSIVECMLENTR